VIEYNRHEMYVEYNKILADEEFKLFVKEEPLGKYPLEMHAGTDWKTATAVDFIKLAYPRSEVGAIYCDEALFLFHLLEQAKPKNVVEIGVYNGTSTRLYAAMAERYDGHITSFDGRLLLAVPLKLKMLGLDHRVTFVEAWSPWFNNVPVTTTDFVFIDGDHSFMSVIVDYHYFNFFAEEGAVFVFHDVNIPEVLEAIKYICKRDQLAEIGSAGRILAYTKTTQREEKYFQVITR
jgi:predicted O-methyltransferase YrrM